MIKYLLVVCLVVLSIVGHSQTIVINEIDSDTPSNDVLEFIELKTSTPFMALDGFVIVLYNGSNDLSYGTFDLDGYTSDANGLLLLGNPDVSPTPRIVFDPNFLQNGADAVALFKDDAASFPNGSAISNTNLVDALVYDTNDADDAELLAGFGKTVQMNEGANSDKDHHSIQRKVDGTYEVKTPTPSALNEGGGILQKSITISTPKKEYNEGEIIEITVTVSEIVTSDLIITCSIESGAFTSTDYSGSLAVTIANGSNTATIHITLTDDTEDEDIETIQIKYINLDDRYQAINENYPLTILDNDFATSSWGNPLRPSYGKVNSTAPKGYYDSLNGKSGQELKEAITAIVADPNTVHAQNYGDMWQMLKEADANPENNNQVWLLYTEQGRYKSLQQGSDGGVGKWNREHVYPQSRGGFTDGTSTKADGKDIYMATDASHLEHGHADGFNLRAADPNENSARNNSDYGTDYNGPVGNKGTWRGAVARSLFYMAVRYNGLSLVSGDPDNSSVGQLGDLDSLLVWHDRYKSDDFEMNRNNVIYTWQNNRNPFIDLPDLADYVYGDKSSLVWNTSSGITNYERAEITHSNPVHDFMYFPSKVTGEISIYNLQGVKILIKKLELNKADLSNLQNGVYFYILKTEHKIYQGKVIKN
ncbi:MAG: endonuclease [Prolixibacteraceae bacterium]